MDNEAPIYARWMPEAGGYVANGNVVSKSPVYDANGKVRLDVDTSVFGSVQSANSPSPNTQVANTPSNNVGITTANVAGSGEDANSMTTNIGAMTSTEINTDNPLESTSSTPATKSPAAGKVYTSYLDKLNQEMQDAIGRNDIQGTINKLMEIQAYTGEDQSEEIERLTRARIDKVMKQDKAYSDAISQAMAQGDTDTARQLIREQQEYRNTVGYSNVLSQQQQMNTQDQKARDISAQDAIEQEYEAKKQEIDINYIPTYMQAIQDIGNGIIQSMNGILNFQYNPATDTALQIAQGYAVSRVKEQMNATGMYYSSMTQSAITKAVAELVPVYQKMAREEAIENFKLLQSTASFLMDLEKTQFDMWRAQIQLQWDANDELRKQRAEAIDMSNARGYFTNEEAALLGVEPGSESFQARKEAQAKLEELEKEQRKLMQDMYLADFNNSLQIEKAEAQARLDDWKNEQQANRNLERDWWNYQYDIDKQNNSAQNQLIRDEQQYRYDINKMAQEYGYRDWLNANEATRKQNQAILEAGLKGEEAPTYEYTTTDENGNEIKIKATATRDPITGNWVDHNGNTLGSGTAPTPSVDQNFAKVYGTDAAKAVNTAWDTYDVSNLDFSNPDNVKSVTNKIVQDSHIRNDKGGVTPSNVTMEGVFLKKAEEVIQNAKYNNNEENTNNAVAKAAQSIGNMISEFAQQPGVDEDLLFATANSMYKELFESIQNYTDANGKNTFDHSKIVKDRNDIIKAEGLERWDVGGMNQGDEAKADAMITVLEKEIFQNQAIPAKLKGKLLQSLSYNVWEWANKDGVNTYDAAKNIGNYSFLVPSNSANYYTDEEMEKARKNLNGTKVGDIKPSTVFGNRPIMYNPWG